MVNLPDYRATKMRRSIQLLMMTAFVLLATVAQAAVKTEGNFVTIDIENAQAGAARVVRLQVVNDNIMRVQATSESQLPVKPASLMIVQQTAKPTTSHRTAWDD